MSTTLYSPKTLASENTTTTNFLVANSNVTGTNSTTQGFPADPLVGYQWYLHNPTPGLLDLNVVDVWQDYTGQGVEVAIVDDAVQWWHPDLASNYSTFKDWDFENGDTSASGEFSDNHGTAVAGIIGATGNNGIGGAGIAYDSTIFGYQVDTFQQIANAIFYASGQNQDGYDGEADIVNISLGNSDQSFFDSFLSSQDMTALNNVIDQAVVVGRNGLGTILVKSAGNARQDNQNTNASSWNANPHTISVAAVDQNGYVSDYSTLGASVLVSAFGTPGQVFTTDRVGIAGDNPFGDYMFDFNGTSAAAPMVSGVVALMLEANPNLGWRDVQEILAYSARGVGSLGSTFSPNPWSAEQYSWTFNGADNWNGGGLHFSNDYGFGLVDAKAAVRLAETWEATPQTSFNQVELTADLLNSSVLISQQGTSFNQFMTTNMAIEHVEVDISFAQWYDLGDLEVRLISPDGTSSILIDNNGENNGTLAGGRTASRWQFFSNAFRGEDTIGNWTVQLFDADSTQISPIVINDIDLTFHGSAATLDDTFIFTEEYSNVASGWAGHSTFINGGAGSDTINAAAVDSNTVVNLATGTGQIDGVAVSISSIEYVVTGDGNDVITGNSSSNTLSGMRGDDVLIGGAGNDSLNGGAGNDVLNGTDPTVWNAGSGQYDVLTGGTGADTFVLGDQFEAFYSGLGYALITDFDWTEGDRFRVHGSLADYSLGFGDWAGDFAQDTLIYYQTDLVGVVQDTTDVDPMFDFAFA
ncbi:S8 family serine peptidase [Leptolyngbya iicbica]|uniref:Furin n=2 Tax=Cyanophyceae TaxID=3028117 RepID=A0A4Q7E7H5_9CYAN|nr:S8 family serine peptidase [Leptolyngbya sp. LK]RZM76575.1 furin [Leptolyngbya sp. LK]